ncbi:MAG: hypothetical protein LBJ88_04750 [Campylobacteraceae bacterium]|jgi:hypothetical protein|nr:hypothetical protein [Campylobacteraceae bacterium]
MKNLLLFLLFTPFLLFSQSIYPLPFTFNDSGLFVKEIVIHNFDVPKIGKGQIIGFGLIDSDENQYFLDDKYPNTPGCTNIKTLDEVLLSEKNKNDVMPNCNTFFKEKDVKEINLKNGIKILTKDSINDIGKYSSYNAKAIIAYDNKILGTMGYISPLHNKEKFLSILQTIKLNNNTKSIDEYVNEAKKNIDRYLINQALKNAISVLLLDPNNKEIKSLLKEIYAKQKELININEKDL